MADRNKPAESDESITEKGRAAELARQKAVAEAVAEANRDQLPNLGGNTWDAEA
jgi:hypothetical protein